MSNPTQSNRSSRGQFICVEGVEGAGKSLNTKFIRVWLEGRSRVVVQTREPGGTPLAEAIRGVALSDWAEGVCPHTELLLMFAARAAHVRGLIKPALEQGRDVVCDRFVDSSYALQGGGRGIPISTIASLEQITLGNLRPDLVLVFDIEPELGLERAKARGVINRFEAETLEFMRKVRQAFLDRASETPNRYIVINAGRPLEQVQADIARTLEARIGVVHD